MAEPSQRKERAHTRAIGEAFARLGLRKLKIGAPNHEGCLLSRKSNAELKGSDVAILVGLSLPPIHVAGRNDHPFACKVRLLHGVRSFDDRSQPSGQRAIQPMSRPRIERPEESDCNQWNERETEPEERRSPTEFSAGMRFVLSSGALHRSHPNRSKVRALFHTQGSGRAWRGGRSRRWGNGRAPSRL
jgi:hypothetical protein